MFLPSGENATELTDQVCPWRGLPTWPPVCASQTRMVSSEEPDTMCLPSGENATELTDQVCPWRGLPTWPPVCASQTQMVSSEEPDTMCLPSGENATELTDFVCPWRICSFLGQSSCSPTATCAIPGKLLTRFLPITELNGKNGNPDKYKCGVLLSITPVKFCTNLITFLINITTSSCFSFPCHFVIGMIAFNLTTVGDLTWNHLSAEVKHQ